MKRHKNNLHRGFSLIEVLLASAIFGIMLTALLGAFFYGEESSALAGNRMRAIDFAEEGIEAVRNIQDTTFTNIGGLSDGIYYLDNTSGEWELDGLLDTFDVFSREIELEAIDGNTTEVTSRVSWQQNVKRTGLIEIVTRFTNWLERQFSETTEAEFALGAFNSVKTTNTGGGEVQAENEGDWFAAYEYLLFDISGGEDVVASFQEDNILWAARNNGFLYKYDISDISEGVITEVDTYDIEALPTSIFIDRSTAYLGSSADSSEIIIVDLSGVNPNVLVDLPNNENVTDIVFANNKIIASRLNSVSAEVVVYNSTGTIELGIIEVGASVNAITADDSYVYMATSNGGSEFWVANYNSCSGGVGLNECTIETQYDPISGGASDGTAIFKVEDNIYFGRANGRINGFLMSGSSVSSEFLDYDNSNDQINDIFVDETREYFYAVTDDTGSQELVIIDISIPEAPSDTVIDLTGTGNTFAIEKQGAYLYLLSGDTNEIQVYATGQEGWGSPQTIDIYDTTGNGDNGTNIVIEGSFAYLTTEDGFWSFDISDPSNVQLEDFLDFNYSINDVFISGDYAYLATSNNSSEFVVVNIANPGNLIEVETLNTDGNSDALSIWVEGNYAYLTTTNNNGGFSNCSNSELYVINISNPLSVSCAGSYDIGGHGFDISIDNGDAFVATALNSAEFMTLNISNPSAVTQRVVYNHSGNNDGLSLHYQNDVLFGGIDIGGGGTDFYAFDVSNRNTYSVLASFDSDASSVNDITIAGNYAFIPNNGNNSELAIIDISAINSGTLTNVATYSAASGTDCSGSATDGTYIYLACDGGSEEFQVIGSASPPSEYAQDAWFTSASFDSGSSSTAWTSIRWSEGDVGDGGCTSDLVFQLRTAPDSGGNPDTWSSWLGPTGIEDYYDDLLGGDIINATHSDGSNDQWIQYRGYFTSDSTCSKVLEDITLTY